MFRIFQVVFKCRSSLLLPSWTLGLLAHCACTLTGNDGLSLNNCNAKRKSSIQDYDESDDSENEEVNNNNFLAFRILQGDISGHKDFMYEREKKKNAIVYKSVVK